MKLTLFTLLAANSALAFPMVKRQSAIVSSITQVLESTITQAASSAASGVLSATEVASSALSSAQSVATAAPSSASAAVSSAVASAIPSAASSAVPSFFPGQFAFPCPSGFELAYVERQTNVDAALADVHTAVSNFTDSSLFTISNTTGDNTPGSTRTVTFEGVPVNEVLTNYTINPETNAIYQNWNSTSEATIGGITVASYATELQTYINDTETSSTAPVSTVKIFSNICASSAASAEAAFGTLFEGALQNGTALIAAGPSASASASGVVSSVVSSAASSASAISSAASQAISSAIAPIVTSASSALQSASAVASSAAAQSSGFAAAPSGPAGPLLVNTPPSLIQCQPAQITFSGGSSGPYFLSVLPGGQSTAAPLLQFAEQPTAGAYTWLVNIAAGTSVTLAVRDGSGAINYSSPVTILPGTDSSCLAA